MRSLQERQFYNQAGLKVRSHLRAGLYIPDGLKYSPNDFWFSPTTGMIGLTDFGKRQVDDSSLIDFLAMPGEQVSEGSPIMTIDSLMGSATLYAPVTGRVVAVNTELLRGDTPVTLRNNPYGEGWLFQFQGVDSSRLMDAATYASRVGG